ncbi:hypothetical protein [Kineococcus sp. SYSU DK004]|uniref:hypothetical protein n=1 Tax=Kineococcus sp. SYSU DK004 TaxID=3383125 RepID=UPI003D7D5919
MSEQSTEPVRLTIPWLQICAGALAAVTSALVLAGARSLGTLGTLLGAALGSVAASTAAAVYNHYLKVSRERVADAARRARERRTAPLPVPPAQDRHPEREDPPAEDAEPAPDPDPRGEEPREVREPAPPARARRRVGRRHAVLVGAAAFAVSVGGIAAWEHASGQTVTSVRQGTAGSGEVERGILGGSITPSPADPATEEPATPGGEPTSTGTATSTDEPTATGTATPDSTGDTTQEPTATGSATGSATSSPTATATSEPTGGAGSAAGDGTAAQGEEAAAAERVAAGAAAVDEAAATAPTAAPRAD